MIIGNSSNSKPGRLSFTDVVDLVLSLVKFTAMPLGKASTTNAL